MRRWRVRSAKFLWPRISAFCLRSSMIFQTRSELSKGASEPTVTEACQTVLRSSASWACCMMGDMEGWWRVKRHAGASMPFARAFAAAEAVAESGRPASFDSSVMMISQALVASRTFSEYFLVTMESSESMAAMRAFISSGRSAPEFRKSARVSSMWRCWMGVRFFAAEFSATALSTAKRRGLRDREE